MIQLAHRSLVDRGILAIIPGRPSFALEGKEASREKHIYVNLYILTSVYGIPDGLSNQQRNQNMETQNYDE